MNTIETLHLKLNREKAVLLYFSSPGCATCHALMPKISSLIATHYPKMGFLEINTVTHPEIAAQYNVFTVPVALIMLEGKESQRFVRNFGLQQLICQLDRIYPLIFE